MKKSTLLSLIVFLAAVAGAVGAAYYYVARKEKELDEYEQLLFCQDYDDEDCDCGCDCGCGEEEQADVTAE